MKGIREDVLSVTIQVTALRLLLQKHGVISRDEYLEVCMMLIEVVQRQTPQLDWKSILQKLEGDQDHPLF